jgi:hypothetical protein
VALTAGVALVIGSVVYLGSGAGAASTPQGTAPTVVYVAQGGADTGSCPSTSPCASISYAISQAAANPTVEISGTIDGNLVLRSSVTLSGADAPPTSPAVLDGSNSGTVLTVPTSASTVHLDHLTVKGGSGVNGGGISNAAFTVLTHSTVSGNVASGEGGGIYNDGGVIDLYNSTVSGNMAGSGGGIADIGYFLQCGSGCQAHGADLSATDSTISGNTATNGNGGGIYNFASGAALASMTVTGNSASGAGGGIYNDGEIDCVGATCYQLGGAIYSGATILAANAGSNCTIGSYSSYNSFDYNLTDDSTGSACGFTQSTDLVGVNPGLGVLAANGGPTQTQLPGPGSPAIGRIPTGTTLPLLQVPVCPGADQRGFARPQPGQSTCAIGAAEPGTVVAAPPTFTSTATATGDVGSSFSYQVSTNGSPTSTVSLAPGSVLPEGVSLIEGGNGTAGLAGTVSKAGTYSFVLQALNGVAPAADQTFTLTVLSRWVSTIRGFPHVSAGGAQGVYVGENADVWRLVVTQPQKLSTRFSGTIVIDAGTFANVTPLGLEPDDTWAVGSGTIQFSFFDHGGTDGISFTTPPGARTATLNLNINGSPIAADQIYLGSSHAVAGLSPLTVGRA